jgi:hypothetical protein
VVALGAGVALVVAARRPLAERILLWQLREQGVTEVSLAVARVGLGALDVRDVRVGDDDLTLRRFGLQYSLGSIAEGRVDSLWVEGLRVRGALRGGELTFGALDALREDGPGRPLAEGPQRWPALAVARLEVDEAVLSLDTEAGRFEAVAEVALDAAGDGRFTLRSTSLAALDSALGIAAEPFALAGAIAFRPDRLELELAPAPFSLALAREAGALRVSGVTPQLRLRGGPGAGGTLRIQGSGGQLALPDADIEARKLSLEAKIDPATRLPSGHASVERVRDLRPKPRFPPLALEATFAPEAEAIVFDASLVDTSRRVVLRLEGAHDLVKGAGSGDLHLEPVRFEEGDLQPRDLFPDLAWRLASVAGTLEADAEIAWGSGGATGFVDVGVRDLSFTTGAAVLDRLNATLRVDGPWPPRVPSAQLVSMARVDFGLELTNGLVSYTVEENGVVELESAEWRFAGGVIRTAGTIDLFARERELLLAVDDVDLGRLLELVNLDGLSGTGRIGGRLPIVQRPDVIEIREAVLTSTVEGGWIRYRPAGGAAALPAAGEPALGDLFAALRNFRYERLTLRVNGDANGPVVVNISLLGANPDYRDGQPYDFNLNVDGRLGDLIRRGSAAYKIPERIEERLRSIAEKRLR